MTSTRAFCGLAVLALLAGALEPGCSRNTSARGSVKLLITDKPFPVDLIDSAVVTITKIELRRAGGEEDVEDGDEASENENDNGTSGGDAGDTSDTGETGDQSVEASALRRGPQQSAGEANENDNAEEAEDGGHGPFIVVYEGEASYDLKELHNGYTAVMGEAEVPAGRYTQMRLHTPGGEVVLSDGRVFPLKVPSGSSSGIKLHVTFEVPEDEETVLLLHVDLSRAFTPIPGGHIEDVSTIRNFKFQPSLAMRLIDMAEAGSITGAVSDADGNPVADAWVTAYLDGEEMAGTATDADGTYRLIGLPPGEYTVEFSKSGFMDQASGSIEVQEGAETSGVDAQLAAQAASEEQEQSPDTPAE